MNGFLIHQMQVNPTQGMTYETLCTLTMNRLPYGSTIFFGESETEEQVKYIHLALQKGFNVLTTTTDIEALQKSFLDVSEQDKILINHRNLSYIHTIQKSFSETKNVISKR